jgi:hypothetical protein
MAGKITNPGGNNMVGLPHFDKLLRLASLLGILLLADAAAGQQPLLRLQHSRATLNLETNVVHAAGYGGLTDNKSASVFNYPNSLSCLVVYGDGKYVLEKRDESIVGKPKVKLAEGALSPEDLQHLKSMLDDEALKKIGALKPPDFPDDAVTVREIESLDAQIDRSPTPQHFTTIKERVKTTAQTGMDDYLDNGTPYQKTLNPLLKWFEGLEKKSKSDFKDSKPQYCVPLNIG